MVAYANLNASAVGRALLAGDGGRRSAAAALEADAPSYKYFGIHARRRWVVLHGSSGAVRTSRVR